MTEAEWLASTSPASMLTDDDTGPRTSSPLFSDRKLRLWVLACREIVEPESDPEADWSNNMSTPADLRHAVREWCWEPIADHACQQAALLRDIVGNPYRPVARWTGNAPIRNGWTPLHVRAILDHLREPGPHTRGCWALDLILGKD